MAGQSVIKVVLGQNKQYRIIKFYTSGNIIERQNWSNYHIAMYADHLYLQSQLCLGDTDWSQKQHKQSILKTLQCRLDNYCNFILLRKISWLEQIGRVANFSQTKCKKPKWDMLREDITATDDITYVEFSRSSLNVFTRQYIYVQATEYNSMWDAQSIHVIYHVRWITMQV